MVHLLRLRVLLVADGIVGVIVGGVVSFRYVGGCDWFSYFIIVGCGVVLRL